MRAVLSLEAAPDDATIKRLSERAGSPILLRRCAAPTTCQIELKVGAATRHQDGSKALEALGSTPGVRWVEIDRNRKPIPIR